MPEEGMYHTSDPEIEMTTHGIRKKFHETIQEIKYQGRSLDIVEAFLVNTNDMNKLHLLFHGSKNVPGGPSDGQMKMYGVKIIESPYIPEGTIFKMFKNEKYMLHPVSPISEAIDVSAMGQAGSGIIPNWGFSKDQVDDAMLPMTTSIDTGEVTTEEITENMKKAIEAVNKALDEPLPSNEKAKEKRHSNKRRIELEE